MTFSDMSEQRVQQQQQPDDEAWVDQFIQNLLLTVQACNRLHQAFDAKFSR